MAVLAPILNFILMIKNLFTPAAVAATSSGVINLSGSSGADITTFTTMGTSLLTWILSCFTSIVTWLLANPIALVGLVLALIGTAFVWLRSTIGG